MALQLTLARTIPVPADQLRIIWQGFRGGDSAEAAWTDRSGSQAWRGDQNLPWMQRDTYVAGEEWKINLPAAPAGCDSIFLRLTSSVGRPVGLAVLPLNGDQEAGVVHPGVDLIADRSTALLEFRRIGPQWHLIALNKPEIVDGQAMAAGSTTLPADDPNGVITGRSIPIPAHLQPAVDRIRASSGEVRRQQVSAVVDISASMRPWLSNGLVSDVLTAVQAVAGASSRPSVSTAFSPAAGSVDLKLEDSPAAALSAQIRRAGLQTGSRSQLDDAVQTAARRGGIAFLLTDEAPAIGAGDGLPTVVTVVLGSANRPLDRPTGTVIAVGQGPIDITLVASDFALAVQGLDQA